MDDLISKLIQFLNIKYPPIITWEPIPGSLGEGRMHRGKVISSLQG